MALQAPPCARGKKVLKANVFGGIDSLLSCSFEELQTGLRLQSVPPSQPRHADLSVHEERGHKVYLHSTFLRIPTC